MKLVLREAGAGGGVGAAAALLSAEPDLPQMVGLTASHSYEAGAAARGVACLRPAPPPYSPSAPCSLARTLYTDNDM